MNNFNIIQFYAGILGMGDKIGLPWMSHSTLSSRSQLLQKISISYLDEYSAWTIIHIITVSHVFPYTTPRKGKSIVWICDSYLTKGNCI